MESLSLSLPDDAKSAARFRAVSRSWRAALSSPFFLDLHLRHANTGPKLLCGPADIEPPLATADDEEEEDDWCFFDVQLGGGGNEPEVIKNLMHDTFPDEMPAPLTKPLCGLILVQSFNDGGYHVCNPVCAASGEEEYKVVRLFTGGGDSDGDFTEACCERGVRPRPAGVRPTAQKPPAHGLLVGEENPGVFLNGSLHFLCRDGGGVVTMNVADETFGSLPAPPPPSAVVGLEITATITELDGRLCVCQRERECGEWPYPYHLWLHGGDDDETARWEKLCCIDPSSWPEDDRNLLKSRWIAPLCLYGDEKKIMLRTGFCRVFAVDVDLAGGGGGGVACAPEILFRPEEHDATAGEFEDTGCPALGLYEESLVPVGLTIEEMVSSSPATRAWSDVLKWLPARTVAELSLVCRAWRAIVTSDRFIRAHAEHPKIAASPARVRFIMDPSFGIPFDADRVGEAPYEPDTFAASFVCGQPCRGLNAGSYINMDFVCNPTVGHHENLILDADDGELWRDDGDIFLGSIALGYDEEKDDHVLVRLAYTEKDIDTRTYQLRCRMRFVREGQWFPRSTPPPRPVASATPAYANGKIYWLVDPTLTPTPPPPSTPPPTACELVSLDCHDAAACDYEVVQGPPCHAGRGRVSILPLRGALCVACSDRDANTIDVWALNNHNDGDGDAWSMVHRLELAAYSPEYTSEKTTVMGVDAASGGRVWLTTGQSLGHYDPETRELVTVYRGTNRLSNDRFCAVICQESLVRYPFRRRFYDE
uniref:F-box domain-containing protein n=1 Tax=Oryza punctata TaxID=4537 RepID=A0A0E0M7L1_ORYPU